MVKLYEDTNIKAIADAIRAKNGTTNTYKTSEMAEAISAIGGSDALIERTATEITSNVTAVANNVFYKYDTLTSASFPNAKSIGSYAFYNCYNISTITAPLAESIGGYAFGSCYDLTSVCFPSCKTVGERGFYGCYYLTTVDLPSVESIETYGFIYCYNLKHVIMRGNKVCTIESGAFNSCYRLSGTVNATHNPDGLRDGHFYVPAALVEAYKADDNWLYYASCFRALEDYTVDGTITGELDESKI